MSLKPVRLVARRFPTWREAIKQHYYRTPVFREMCDDYHEIVGALAYWTLRTDDVLDDDQVPPSQASERAALIAEDYLAALNELEMEILRYLRCHVVLAVRGRHFDLD